jgi:hypothetical protein
MQPPKSEVCVICGVAQAETLDHVPPKAFFKGVKNAQLLTVPACALCNNGSSSDDEDVRFYISALIGRQNFASDALWRDGAHKTILRKKRLRDSFLESAREVQGRDESGLRSPRIQFLVPERPYHRVFARTTRGLYFVHSARILPAEIPVSVNMLESAPDMHAADFRIFNFRSIGNGACNYWYAIAPEDVDSSTWVYQFHGAHWCVVTTGQLTVPMPGESQ